MPTGTVKFFNAAKKFGFVSPDDGGKDVFVPIASMTAASISVLIAGQRVSFDTAPDTRGPKVVNLKLIDGPAPPPAAKKVASGVQGAHAAQQLTFYYDPSSDSANEMLAMLRQNGFAPRVIDYIAAPPSVEELKKLSMHLGAGSLVRRYDSLFHELRLDDRFIGQTEFWNGIFEHPVLINGPLLATANRTCVCRSDDVMREFLQNVFPGHIWPASVESALPKSAVTSAPEMVTVRAAPANVNTAAPELPDAEPVAPTAESRAKKAAKVPPKKKGVSAKPAAAKAVKPKVAKKPVPKAVAKPARAKKK